MTLEQWIAEFPLQKRNCEASNLGADLQWRVRKCEFLDHKHQSGVEGKKGRKLSLVNSLTDSLHGFSLINHPKIILFV